MTISQILLFIHQTRTHTGIQSETKRIFRKILKVAFFSHLSNVLDEDLAEREGLTEDDAAHRKIQCMRGYLLGDSAHSLRTFNDE